MAKKIKRSKTGSPTIDPNLEEVDEDRAFEIELDEDSNEILFVHHYRHKWGDGFDSDIEHGFTIEEAKQMVVVLLQMIEDVENTRKQNLQKKSTPELLEGNPIKEYKNVDGK